MGLRDVAVRVPVADAISACRIAAVEELDDSNTFLQQSSSKNAVVGVSLLQVRAGVGSVGFVNVLRFVGDARDVGDRCLHAARQFIAGDSSSEIRIPRVLLKVFRVQPLKQRDARAI